MGCYGCGECIIQLETPSAIKLDAYTFRVALRNIINLVSLAGTNKRLTGLTITVNCCGDIIRHLSIIKLDPVRRRPPVDWPAEYGECTTAKFACVRLHDITSNWYNNKIASVFIDVDKPNEVFKFSSIVLIGSLPLADTKAGLLLRVGGLEPCSKSDSIAPFI